MRNELTREALEMETLVETETIKDWIEEGTEKPVKENEEGVKKGKEIDVYCLNVNYPPPVLCLTCLSIWSPTDSTLCALGACKRRHLPEDSEEPRPSAF